MDYHLGCVSCDRKYPGHEIRYRCDCGEILEVRRTDFPKLKGTINRELFKNRRSHLELPFVSGVWRYKELVLPLHNKYIVSKPEGNTNLYNVGKMVPTGLAKIGSYAGLPTLYLKHEGENPTGSFKDRGMTVGISVAKSLGVTAVACASTGNTSASLAAYAALAGLRCFVFIPEGKISYGKLSQSLAYGATTIQIKGDFDAAMRLVQEVCRKLHIYLLNSINPYRIEGQKSIVFELLEQLDWRVPDYIALPAGNLGNISAIGKGLVELKELSLISKLPRLVAIQASGANPFYQSFKSRFKKRFTVKPETIASAIRIGNPVSYSKAVKVIQETRGLVEEVSDAEILEAKAVIDAAGVGCEPASATTVAGLKKLVASGKIARKSTVVGILTGHLLKDTDTTLAYHTGKLARVSGYLKNDIITAGSEIEDIVRLIKKR